MKSLLVITISILLGLAATAQKKNISINHSIDDNGKTLSIKIKGTIDGRPIDYNRTFDVGGMSKQQRDEIKRNVYDSLGLANPTAPLAPLSPNVSLELTAPSEPAAPAAPVVSAKSQFAETYTIGGDHPYTKEIRYNPKTGILYMKYRFVKDGEEITKEKSIEAKDKSREERESIIRKYEREIGVAQPEII
jgi:hypothetical protein